MTQLWHSIPLVFVSSWKVKGKSNRERPSSSWFTSPMPFHTQGWPGWSQEPEVPAAAPKWKSGTEVLRPSLAVCRGAREQSQGHNPDTATRAVCRIVQTSASDACPRPLSYRGMLSENLDVHDISTVKLKINEDTSSKQHILNWWRKIANFF